MKIIAPLFRLRAFNVASQVTTRIGQVANGEIGGREHFKRGQRFTARLIVLNVLPRPDATQNDKHGNSTKPQRIHLLTTIPYCDLLRASRRTRGRPKDEKAEPTRS